MATDKQACFGRKGKDKHWHGYKIRVSVGMQSGLIDKILQPLRRMFLMA
ncbi:MAG: hypothetical protein HRT36_04680 [Alphaproteobacteria bacterium]|nr:hypothetical protein [Alphaproteobacteria bacterium]